jgi:hypothetical protein
MPKFGNGNGKVQKTKDQLYLKKCLYEPHTLPSNSWLSKTACPHFLKVYQVTNFDMGFQKKRFLGRFEDLDFFYRRTST